jgi:CRISPR-associated exonuclease Cas4
LTDTDRSVEPIPVSALEHFVYCPRQWALIHLEQAFDDNDDTVRGHHDHERVDDAGSTARGDLIVERRLPIWSESLGLYGFCDVVERRGQDITPVEYKSGRTFARAAEVQLAAQAMCLEEMLGCDVPGGVIYSVGSNTRHLVAIDDELRRLVVDTVAAIRRQAGDRMPGPVADVRCRRCSLRERCMPQLVADPRLVSRLAAGTVEA